MEQVIYAPLLIKVYLVNYTKFSYNFLHVDSLARRDVKGVDKHKNTKDCIEMNVIRVKLREENQTSDDILQENV